MSPARNAGAIPAQAIVLICGSVLCFTLLDTTMKYLTHFFPVPLLVWGRWTVQVVATMLWLGRGGVGELLRTERLPMHLFRGGILLCSSLCFMTALRYLPLADATAINYSTPILVALMATFILKERLTRARMGFVLAGFAGMLLIVRPGSEILTGAALLAMGSAGFYATFQILTRMLSGENPKVLLFVPALVGTVVLTLALPWIDLPPQVSWVHVAMLIAGSLMGTFGHFLFILAFSRAQASGLAPFTYLQLVWATLLGWLVFGDFPGVFTLLGMGVIAGSGLLLALHEQRRSAAAAPDPTSVG